jgi:preprotein translocase subunit YajC
MYLNFLEAAGNGGNAAAAGGGGLFSIVIMLAPMLLIFYFMLIRPEKKRKKEAEALRNALKEGDKITTIGGLTGVIVNIKENTFVIETSADQVRIELAKWALSTNDSANERAAEQAKKAREDREKAIAAKRAELAEKKAAKKNKK